MKNEIQTLELVTAVPLTDLELTDPASLLQRRVDLERLADLKRSQGAKDRLATERAETTAKAAAQKELDALTIELGKVSASIDRGLKSTETAFTKYRDLFLLAQVARQNAGNAKQNGRDQLTRAMFKLAPAVASELQLDRVMRPHAATMAGQQQ